MEDLSFLRDRLVLNYLFTICTAFLLYSGIRFIQKIIIRKGTVRANQTETLVDDFIIELVNGLKRYFIFAVSLYVGIFWIVLSSSQRVIVDKVFLLIILIQFAHIASLVINFLMRKHFRGKLDQDLALASTLSLISVLSKGVIYLLLLLVALNNVGVDITALIAGLGVGGIAVALALQNILSDLFASLTIVLDKPFIVGDFIVVNDFAGTVEHIGLKTTRLKSISGEQLIFGNGDLLQSKIRNYKRMQERRVVQSLTVTYQTSADSLEKIPLLIKEIIDHQNNVRFDRCHFLKFQDSSLEFEMVYWVLSREFNDYADRAHKINIEIFRRFGQEKIDFAYPTRTLFVQST